MGISGLLPLLKSIHKHTSLKTFSGQTIGIDAYGWLHRGAVACAIELALDKPTTKYIDFAVNKVRMLLDFGITPYLVFDGDALPSKAGTNEERRKRRNEAKSLGLTLYKAGNLSQAYQELQKAAGVTPHMARELIEELKRMDVPYVVAPYEADAQLFYLEKKGIINAILSEDSDLLVFGAKRLLTKLDQYGDCVEIDRGDFALCKEISLAGWTDTMFRRMAILSGCDYLANIDKMGLKTAYRFIRKHRDAEKAIRMIALDGKFIVPPNYMEGFRKAELTFLHHRVFCPVRKEMIFLADLPHGTREEDLPFLGAYVGPEIMIDVAMGNLNPKTKQPITLDKVLMKRPVLGDNRRSTFNTRSELKPKSSIDSFFKPQRQPLAELDPNSLTPSPSQQRLLERHRNTSWEPRMISSAPPLRSIASQPSLRDAGRASSNLSNRGNFLARAATLSNFQSSKRQRLCADTDETSPSTTIQQSPFFASPSANNSPLALKKSRLRRSRKSEFDVWSDDSVENIMLGFEDVQQVASPSGKDQRDGTSQNRNEQHEEEAEVDVVPASSPARQQTPPDESQSSHGTNDFGDLDLQSRSATQTSTESFVSAQEDPGQFDELLEVHIRQQNSRLAKTFASQTPSFQIEALQSLSSTASESKGLLRGIEVARLGKEVQASSADTMEAPKASVQSFMRTFTFQPNDLQENALRSLGRSKIDHETSEAMDHSRPQEGATKGVDQFRTVRILGSEDEIIPNSEDETSETEEESSRPVLDLKAFVYAG